MSLTHRAWLVVLVLTIEWRGLNGQSARQGVPRVRVVRLAGPETPLAGTVAARWRLLADTVLKVSTVPLLIVADYLPREP